MHCLIHILIYINNTWMFFCTCTGFHTTLMYFISSYQHSFSLYFNIRHSFSIYFNIKSLCIPYLYCLNGYLTIDIRGLYDKLVDFCCYFVICLLIIMKVTNKYNKYVFNIKLECYWKYLYSSHLEVAIWQPWKQLPEHFDFLIIF